MFTERPESNVLRRSVRKSFNTLIVSPSLTPVPVEHVKAPAIAESPVNIACRVVESHPLGSHTMFVAEVLGVTVDDAYLDETGKFDINGTGLIMYSHGEYFALGKKLGKFGYSVQKKKK